jgi:hypothetical protein
VFSARVPKHSASLLGTASIAPKIDLGPDGARTSVHRACEGEVSADIFGFLICEPNTEIGRAHPKGTPVILTMSKEHDIRLRALGPRPRRYSGRFRTVH